MASEQQVREAFAIQEFYCRTMGTPMYARLCTALEHGLTRDTAVGAAILDWPGEPTRDALPLRFIGGLNALVLERADDELAAVFAGEIDGHDAIVAVLGRVLARHDAALLPWLDGPPQTNEPGRSAGLMLGLMEIARRHGPRIEVIEIGSSAGLNLLIGRYRFDLGGTVVGPDDAPVTIMPEWRGAPPAPVAIEIVSTAGCDVRPMDAADPAVERRLAAYVWPEAAGRLERLRAAAAMARERPVDLIAADAADFVEERLARPQEAGVARVLMHSVVWQYLPDAVAERIRQAMTAASERADASRPLGWVMFEPDRALGRQMVRVRSWPGHDAWDTLATAHAHGAWIDTAPVEGLQGIDLPETARVRVG
ncbi:hypothetical protein GGQ80_003410 [Sphingomonas jinjuensis]|uniref:DUF2332 domain-containing protein n=1 Tax=Sphingomonas jinjuensis TaxID=535907 RepID=A0A840FIG6_9SPHN|nr:DUF2332 family protein [Sphingomonas jinjuensis]MBB4155487.1 hypothetical protein [Sphingomonas jinjuensis]